MAKLSETVDELETFGKRGHRGFPCFFCGKMVRRGGMWLASGGALYICSDEKCRCDLNNLVADVEADSSS